MPSHAARCPGADAPLVAPPAARIVGGFGYRIDGDTACLRAEIDWAEDAAALAPWRLQLWARPVGTDGPALPLAEMAVGVPAQSQAEPTYVEAYVAATPPPGDGLHTIALRLVCGAGSGAALHDRAEFPEPARFVQPRVESLTLARAPGGLWALEAGRIVDPRPAGRGGGALSLELWALAAPYDGGAIDGCCLAAQSLPALAGGRESGPVSLWFADPSERDAGRPWCLLLREWTPAGYITRDLAAVPPLSALAAGRVHMLRPAGERAGVAVAAAAGATAHRARPVRRRPRVSAGGLAGWRVVGLVQRLAARIAAPWRQRLPLPARG